MNHVRRMVFKAMRDKRLKALVLRKFTAFDCFSPYKDLDWGYEISKAEFVAQAISDENLSHGIREAKRWFRENDWGAYWYPEWQRLAKEILREWRRSRYD